MPHSRTVEIRRDHLVPIEARWADDTKPAALASEVNDLLVILHQRLVSGDDEYSSDGAQFLFPLLKRLEDRLRSVHSVETQDQLLGDFYELSTINQELDRIPDEEANLIIEEIVSVCGCAVTYLKDLDRDSGKSV